MVIKNHHYMLRTTKKGTILKWILMKKHVRMRTEFICFKLKANGWHL
jgi:hypothetical protein